MFWGFKQQYHILYSNNKKTSLLLFRSNNREIEGWVFAHVKFIIFTLQLYMNYTDTHTRVHCSFTFIRTSFCFNISYTWWMRYISFAKKKLCFIAGEKLLQFNYIFFVIVIWWKSALNVRQHKFLASKMFVIYRLRERNRHYLMCSGFIFLVTKMGAAICLY